MEKKKNQFWIYVWIACLLFIVIPFLFHVPILMNGKTTQGTVIDTQVSYTSGSIRTSKSKMSVNLISFQTPKGSVITKGVENCVDQRGAKVTVLYYPNDVYNNTIYSFTGLYFGEFSFVPFGFTLLMIILYFWSEKPFKRLG